MTPVIKKSIRTIWSLLPVPSLQSVSRQGNLSAKSIDWNGIKVRYIPWSIGATSVGHPSLLPAKQTRLISRSVDAWVHLPSAAIRQMKWRKSQMIHLPTTSLNNTILLYYIPRLNPGCKWLFSFPIWPGNGGRAASQKTKSHLQKWIIDTPQ